MKSKTIASIALLATFALLCGCVPTTPEDSSGVALDIRSRVENRSYVSLFQPWSNADLESTRFTADEGTREYEEELREACAAEIESMARFDLSWRQPQALPYLLDWNASESYQTFTENSRDEALLRRQELLLANENMTLLMQLMWEGVRAVELTTYLPLNPAFFLSGTVLADETIVGDEDGMVYFNYNNPDLRSILVAKAREAVESGIFDGVMLDLWTTAADIDDRIDEETAAARTPADYNDGRMDLLVELRAAIGDEALIIVNDNLRKQPWSFQHINGVFMEGSSMYQSVPDEGGDPGDFLPYDFENTDRTSRWHQVAEMLDYNETRMGNLRSWPVINCLEIMTGDLIHIQDTSARNLAVQQSVRATITISLTNSDGYALFHNGDYHDFFDIELGRPLEERKRPRDTNENGAYVREFENGTAIHNPCGNEMGRDGTIELTFRETRKQASTGEIGRTFLLDSEDGDVFLYEDGDEFLHEDGISQPESERDPFIPDR